MKASAPMARAAASTSARVASGRQKAMLSAIVPLNRKFWRDGSGWNNGAVTGLT